MVKAFATGANAFPIQFASVLSTQGLMYFGVLRFVYDYLRRGFSYFELGAHFLDLRGLLFELRNHRLHFTLQFTNACLLLLDLLVLFEELVKQQDVDLIVFHREWCAVHVGHQAGVNLGHILGDQTIQRRP